METVLNLEKIKNLIFENNFNFEISDKDFEKLINGYKIEQKDNKVGDILFIDDIIYINDDYFEVLTNTNIKVKIYFKKELKFFKIFFNLNKNDEIDLIKNYDSLICLKNHPLVIKNDITKKDFVSLFDGYILNKKKEFLEQLNLNNKIYTAKILRLNSGGFIVDVDGYEMFLPGSLASNNKINNFDEKLFVNRKIPVMIEDYLRDSDTFICSYKKYLNYILDEKIKELSLEKKYTGKITGIEDFGIFLEFNEFYTGLLHISEMDFETLTKYKNKEFKIEDEISFYIKNIENSKRIILTQNIYDEQIWNDLKNSEQTFVVGKITKTVKFGFFVNFYFNGKTFSGLCHKNNIKNKSILFKENLLKLDLDFKIENVDLENKRIILSL